MYGKHISKPCGTAAVGLLNTNRKSHNAHRPAKSASHGNINRENHQPPNVTQDPGDTAAACRNPTTNSSGDPDYRDVILQEQQPNSAPPRLWRLNEEHTFSWREGRVHKETLQQCRLYCRHHSRESGSSMAVDSPLSERGSLGSREVFIHWPQAIDSRSKAGFTVPWGVAGSGPRARPSPKLIHSGLAEISQTGICHSRSDKRQQSHVSI